METALSLRQHGTADFICMSVFALYERKNRNTDTMRSTMLPQAKSRFHAALRTSCQL